MSRSLSALRRALQGRSAGELRPAWNALGEPLDLLVVGGGVHGAGVARDAALRGLRVGIIEQGDWAGGTSSRSSKLFHGGLRYLAGGRLSLVRSSQKERDLHVRLMPTLVRPLKFQVELPGQSAWTRLKFRGGVGLYHLLTGGSSRGRIWGKEISYHDALCDDARFVWELLRDARRHGAVAVNYCRLEAWERDPGGVILSARVVDRLTGASQTVRARAWVNAAGPWVPELEPQGALRLTRGTHVVLRGQAEDGGAKVFLSPQDDRVMFLIPYLDGCSLLGTTDVDTAAPESDPRPSAAELRYLHRAFTDTFPDYRSWPAVGWQCGLRPLVPGEGRPSDVSREEKILESPGSLWSVVGGKYTGYRAVAEKVVNAVTGSPAEPGASTRFMPLEPEPAGGDVWEAAFHQEDAVLLEDALFRRTFLAHSGAAESVVRTTGRAFTRRWDLAPEEGAALAETFLEELRDRHRVLDLWG